MNDPGHFLKRWSRRKTELRREAEQPDEVKRGDAAGEPAAPTAQVSAAKPAKSELPASAPAFDPASLPAIDSITATTDIRGFLKPGVPVELRNAALRRAWSIDPAVRDFRGLQENDWDFNDPNGIPGFGPLDPGLDIKKMASALFGDGQKRGEAADTTAIGEAQSAAKGPARATGETQSDVYRSNNQIVQSEENIAPQNNRAEVQPAAGKHRRRRGGALPQS